MYSSSLPVNIYAYVTSSSFPCKYHFDTSSYSITEYDVEVSYISSGTYLEVYLEESQGSYTHKATLDSSGNSTTVSMSSGSYDDMFIILIPSGGAIANFSVSVRTSSSSSSSRYRGTSTGLSGGAIAGIVIGSILFIGFFVGLSIFGQYMKNKRIREQNEAAARVIQNMNRTRDAPIFVPSQPQPQPMMIQPQPMVMQPQPMPMQPLYNPAYANNYPNQPAFDQDPAMGYPQGIPIAKPDPLMPSAPESVVQSDIRIQPSKPQPRGPSTYYAS